MKTRFWLSLLLIVISTLAACSAGKAPEACSIDKFGCAVIEPNGTIKIGMGGPMTGGSANFGLDISQGAQVAIADAGEFEGFKFELVVEDDEGTPEGGASVANKLVMDKNVVAVVGHVMSGPTDAAMPIYEKAGIPMMSPAATNIKLTQEGSSVFNRVAFTDAMQARFAAEYLYNKLAIRNLALIHDSTAYGSGIAEEVRKDFEGLGGKIVGFEAITRGEADYSAPLVKVAAAQPQALYFGGSVQEGVVLVNQMKAAGLTNAIFFGDDGTFGSDFLTRTGPNGEGAYSTSFTLPESDVKTRFDAAYEKAYGIPPGKLCPFTWNGYDSAAPLILAVKSVAIKGNDGKLYIPRGALIAAVRNTKGYEGVTGTVTCSPVGECSAAQPTFYVIQNGQWVEAPK